MLYRGKQLSEKEEIHFMTVLLENYLVWVDALRALGAERDTDPVLGLEKMRLLRRIVDKEWETWSSLYPQCEYYEYLD